MPSSDDIAIIGWNVSPMVRSTNKTEAQMLLEVITGAVEDAGITRKEVDFTCAGSCDYVAGQAFSFVQNIDAIGAWPPKRDSHVESCLASSASTDATPSNVGASTSAPADRSPAASASFLLTRGSRMRRPASGPRRADPAELVTSPGTPWGAPASLTADLFSSEGRRAGR